MKKKVESSQPNSILQKFIDTYICTSMLDMVQSAIVQSARGNGVEQVLSKKITEYRSGIHMSGTFQQKVKFKTNAIIGSQAKWRGAEITDYAAIM